jgi:hypothetical protein
VVSHGRSLADVSRMFEGVNIMKVKETLLDLLISPRPRPTLVLGSAKELRNDRP